MAKMVYIENLKPGMTEARLRALFEAHGEVVSVDVVTDRLSSKTRASAFVEMAEESAAAQAIAELNGKPVDGRTVKVAEARPRRERRDSWGGGSRTGRYDSYPGDAGESGPERDEEEDQD